MNLKWCRNKIRTAIIWLTQYGSLSAEDEWHMLTDMSSWELFLPSFYRTHTEEEIKEATEAAVARIRVMLDELEMLEKQMKIFLDDTKLCPLGWTWVKTIDDFKSIIQENADNLEVISLDYELEVTDKGRTGLDACRYLIGNDIRCPKIVIHSTHPHARKMRELLEEHMKSTEIIMEEYSIFEVMKEYDNSRK